MIGNSSTLTEQQKTYNVIVELEQFLNKNSLYEWQHIIVLHLVSLL